MGYLHNALRRSSLLMFSILLLVSLPLTVLSAACSLCKDGSPPSLPDRVVHIPPLAATSCSHAHAILPLLITDEEDEFCVVLRSLSSICGCPRRSDACNLCPDGSPVINKTLELPEFPPLTEASLFTCELMEAYIHSFPESDRECGNSQQIAAEKCGCPKVPTEESTNSSTTLEGTNTFGGGPIEDDPESPLFSPPAVTHISYLGTKSFSDMDILYATLRTGAALSILGALLVIQDTLRSKKRRNCLYNRIVVLMAMFDIVYTIAVALINIPAPTDDYLKVPEERGNQATCKAQGWFIQWGGMTSLFLNASLSTYYTLVVVRNRRETRLRAASKWLLGIPIVAGLILASASIPFISSSIQGCHIPPPSTRVVEQLELEGSTASWGPYLGLYIVPAYAVIAYTTGSLLRVYLHVRKINSKANKWRFPILTSKSHAGTLQEGSSRRSNPSSAASRRQSRRGRNSVRVRQSETLQKELAIQSAMYLVALYLSWFVHLVMAVNLDKYLLSHFHLWCFVYFLIPLQGFLNSLTYFRPRLATLLSKCCQTVRIRLQRPRQVPSEEADTDVVISFEDNRNESSTNSSMHTKDAWAVIEPAADLEVMPEEAFEASSEMNRSISGISQVDQASSTLPPSQQESCSLSSSAAHPLDRPQEVQ